MEKGVGDDRSVDYLFVTTWYVTSRITAPITAPMKPADCPAAYSPATWPRNVAASEPPMPSAAVMKKPLGPPPGASILATRPATKPIKMVQIKCTTVFLRE